MIGQMKSALLAGSIIAGFCAAAGFALVNSVGNLGGFVGPSAVGWITERTGSFYGGLAFAGACLFVSATLTLLLPKRGSSPLPPTAMANKTGAA